MLTLISTVTGEYSSWGDNLMDIRFNDIYAEYGIRMILYPLGCGGLIGLLSAELGVRYATFLPLILLGGMIGLAHVALNRPFRLKGSLFSGIILAVVFSAIAIVMPAVGLLLSRLFLPIFLGTTLFSLTLLAVDRWFTVRYVEPKFLLLYLLTAVLVFLILRLKYTLMWHSDLPFFWINAGGDGLAIYVYLQVSLFHRLAGSREASGKTARC